MKYKINTMSGIVGCLKIIMGIRIQARNNAFRNVMPGNPARKGRDNFQGCNILLRFLTKEGLMGNYSAKAIKVRLV